MKYWKCTDSQNCDNSICLSQGQKIHNHSGCGEGHFVEILKSEYDQILENYYGKSKRDINAIT